MRKIGLSLFVGVLCFSPNLMAAMVSGQMLLEWCQQDDKKGCAYFVLGAIDGLDSAVAQAKLLRSDEAIPESTKTQVESTEFYKTLTCFPKIPPGTAAGVLVDDVVQYLTSETAQLTLPAAGLVDLALTRKYGCM